jgi:hypothetical protein
VGRGAVDLAVDLCKCPSCKVCVSGIFFPLYVHYDAVLAEGEERYKFDVSLNRIT